MTGVHIPALSGRPGLLGELARSEAADRLRAAAQEYLEAQARRLLAGAGRGLGLATVRITEIAEGRSPGFARLARDTGRKLVAGKGPARAALEIAVARLTDRSGLSAARPLVVVEQIDVGVPARTAYEEWARHPDARPVPDDRLVWTAHGLRGVVSFHPLADRLTRVLLVAEHLPESPAGRAGALLRVPRHRARRDLADFARHVALSGVPEGDSPSAVSEDDRPTTRGSRR
ncbi:cyclase/dehydrase [Streptomyces sp.]|uniref:cyclase/dehydrase n=1 Tax=Streptomyces sp. TaxID=1931 RepID=UPI002D3A1A33|nr:cyclase/dehydrase [Streptomyces sp.]HZF88159.1 cyclase/dehydrase [Streptomyces sp.]